MTISEFLSTLRFFFSSKQSLGLSIFEINGAQLSELALPSRFGKYIQFLFMSANMYVLVELIGGKRRKYLQSRKNTAMKLSVPSRGACISNLMQKARVA